MRRVLPDADGGSALNITPTAVLPEVLVIEPRTLHDLRGYFLETWSAGRYEAHGLPAAFVQDNLSLSARGVLRGLHLQHPRGQGKLVSVPQGEVFDVAVDLRCGSPRFGRWIAVVLSGDNRHQLYVPPGFAHGFVVLSGEALVAYKCTDYYHPPSELSVRWDDPQLGIEWPVAAPVMSPKDAAAPALAALPRHVLPTYCADAAVIQTPG